MECMWNAVLPANRDAFLATQTGYPDDRLLEDGDFKVRISKACGIDASGWNAARFALMGYAARTATAQFLHARYKLDDERLQSAWKALPPERHDELKRAYIEVGMGVHGGPTDSDRALIKDIAESNGVTDADGQKHVEMYYFFQVTYEHGEDLMGGAPARRP